jgi:hypothetical protein
MPKKVPEIRVSALAAGIAGGKSLARAARDLKLAESTCRRWAADPTFPARVAKIREQLLHRIIGRYVTMMIKGQSKVLKALSDATDPETVSKIHHVNVVDFLALQTHAIESATVATLRGRLEPETPDSTT